MTGQEFVVTFIKFIGIWFVLLNFGFFILKKLKYTDTGLEKIGISFLLSTGVFTYLTLILGTLSIFTSNNVLLLLLLLLIVSRSCLKELLIYLKKVSLSVFSDIRKELSSIIFFTLSILIAGSLYLSALQPPSAADELHYHMPEVREILDSNKIDLEFGGHYFYGNIPKFMEIVFAWSAEIGGYGMSHLLNFSILLSFLFVVFGILNKKFSSRVALIAVLFILGYDDLTWNATTGYIDAATLSFELSSLLIVLNWITNKKNNSQLLVSGLLMGLSLASKYSPIPTLLFVIFILILDEKKDYRKAFKNLFIFGLCSSITGAFWYIKNTINFANPFYPLYFGHKGVSEETYSSLVDAINQFGPKTLSNFLRLLDYFKTINGLHVYISFFAAFFVLFDNKEKGFKLKLLSYFLLYTLYWFFFATHQIRFLAPAIVISLILVSTLIQKIKPGILTVLIVGSGIVFIFLGSPWKSLITTKLHVTERQYALGNISKDDFLIRNFGCQYKIIKFLRDNNLHGKVIDNWSVWHAPSVSFYAENGQFLTFGESIDDPDVLERQLIESKIEYIYFDQKVKEEHLIDEDPIVSKAKTPKLRTEEYLLSKSKEIFSEGNCHLYKLPADIN